MPRWAPAVLLCVGLVGCTTTAIDGAASMAPPTTSSVADRAERSTAQLRASMPPNEPGCTAAAGIDGAVVWADASGLSDVDAWTPLTTSDRFDITAESEQFTATAILLLAQDGRLSLSDPVSAHVAGMPAWADRVTIADLLHHTSGLEDIAWLLRGAGFTAEQAVNQHDALVQLAKFDQLRFEPGSVFESSGSNYLLLGEIVHTASGQELPDFLQSRIFGPLALDMSVGPAGRDDLPTGYTTNLGKLVQEHSNWLLFGPAFIFTTPSQLVRWADNYRTGMVGGPELLAAQMAGAVPMTSASNTDREAAGIVVAGDGALTTDGMTWGQAGEFVVASDRHTSIAIECNRNDRHDALESLGTKLRGIWFGRS